MTFLSFAGILLAASLPQGEVAFVWETEADGRTVAVIDLESGAVRRVGTGNFDGPPRWRPGGGFLAFEGGRDGGRSIFVVGADGDGLRELPHGNRVNRDPRWSPDGKKLAYVAGVGAEQRIVVYDVEADEERLWGGGTAGLLRPVWLRAESVLAMMAESEEGLKRESELLQGVDLEAPLLLLAIGVGPSGGGATTDLVLVTPSAVVPFPEAVMPSRGPYAEWAVEPEPKGRRIAFESNDGGDREIFVITKKGTFDLSNHGAADWNPRWSPDGKWISFESFRGGRRGIYKVYRDTIRVFPVAVSPHGDNWAPSWSPNGKWLAFVSDRLGGAALYIVEAAGSEARHISMGAAGAAYAPAWRPKGD